MFEVIKEIKVLPVTGLLPLFTANFRNFLNFKCFLNFELHTCHANTHFYFVTFIYRLQGKETESFLIFNKHIKALLAPNTNPITNSPLYMRNGSNWLTVLTRDGSWLLMCTNFYCMAAGSNSVFVLLEISRRMSNLWPLVAPFVQISNL